MAQTPTRRVQSHVRTREGRGSEPRPGPGASHAFNDGRRFHPHSWAFMSATPVDEVEDTDAVDY